MVYMDNKGIKKMEKHIFWRLINLFPDFVTQKTLIL